jgi:hypothetical protein
MENRDQEYTAIQLAVKELKEDELREAERVAARESGTHYRVDTETCTVVMTDSLADWIEVFDTEEEAVNALGQYKLDILEN